MRKAIILLLLSYFEVTGQDNFVRGVMMFHNTKVDFKQLKDSLHINWIQAVVESTKGEISEEVLQNNGSLNIIGVAEKVIYQKSKAQRMEFEGYSIPDVDINNYFNKHSTGEKYLKNSWKVVTGVHAAGYIVQDPMPDNEYRLGEREYRVKFVLMVDKKEENNLINVETNDEVVRLEIWCKNNDSLLNSKIMRYSDFIGDEFEEKQLEFSFKENPKQTTKADGVLFGKKESSKTSIGCLINNEYRIDIRVFWYGKVTTYLDKVIVEDKLGEELFTEKYDTDLKISAEGFKSNYPLLKRYYLIDEAPISTFLAYDYIQKKILSIYGNTMLKTGTSITAQNQNLNRFILEANARELFVNYYPIKSNIPSPSINNDDAAKVGIASFETEERYNSVLQTALYNDYNSRLKKAKELTHDKGIDLWVIPQLHGEYFEKNGEFNKPSGETRCRPPTGNEVKLMCNLAIAYGAKGIFPYPLGTDRVDWGNGEGSAIFAGLLSEILDINGMHRDHSSDIGIFNGIKIWMGYKDKWDAVSEVMYNYKILSPVLSELQYIGTKSWDTLNISKGWINKIKKIEVKNEDKLDQVKYVETGHFKILSEDYLYIVNKFTLPKDKREISITLDNADQILEITDVNNGNKNYILPNESWRSQYLPAEAKLIKVREWVVNNLAIKNVVGSVQLVWDSITFNILEKYIIERKINDNDWEIIGVELKSNFIDSEIRISNTNSISYRVYATSKYNLTNSKYSNIVTTGGKYLPIKQGGKVGKVNKFSVSNSFPNPFNPTTTIEYEIAVSEIVNIKLYDISGRLINILVDEFKLSGRYSLNVEGSSLPNGSYIIRINVGNFSEERKIILLK